MAATVTAAQSAARTAAARVAHQAWLAQHAEAAAARLAAGKKLCACCGETKTLDQFNRHGRAADGLQSYCRPCTAGSMRRSRENGRKAAMVATANKRRRAAERLAAGCKRCARCDETQPLDAFPVVGPWSADGYHRLCTPCLQAQQAEWHQARLARKRALAELAQREAMAAAAAALELKRQQEAAAAQQRARERAAAVALRPAAPKPCRQPMVVLACCGGPVYWGVQADWWRVQHQPGCAERWQPSVPEPRP